MSILEENLELYQRYDPRTALALEAVDPSSLCLCETAFGEANLYEELSDGIHYYHSQEGALKEAKQWFQKVGAARYSLLIVYGVGMGYYYDAARTWLKSNPKHVLVFLEDDLRVLRRLFESPKGSSLLHDPQVFIQHIETRDRQLTPTFQKSIHDLLSGFFRSATFYTCLKYYWASRPELCQAMRGQIYILSNRIGMTLQEHVSGKAFENFYHNILLLDEAQPASELYGGFRGVPALVCGAGPSLIKQIPRIKALQGQALIMASGTAMNVLNNHGIIPHFGTGLDPTPAQGSRLMTNTAFETPFFYRNRFYYPALRVLQGPRLFIRGFNQFLLPGWFEEQLGVMSGEYIKPGISSTNFCLQILKALGCHPIILVGVDLAYTNSARYAAGVTTHPTDNAVEKKKLTQQESTLLNANTASGEPVHTKLEWLFEARLISQLQAELGCIINATEGGMAIEGVPDETFEAVVNRELKRQEDIEGRIHNQIQNTTFPLVDKAQILTVYHKWLTSLERCEEIYEEWQQQLHEGRNESAYFEAQLMDEPAYLYLINDFIRIPPLYSFALRQRLRCHPELFSPEEKRRAELQVIDISCQFYLQTLRSHLKMAREALEQNSCLSVHSASAVPAPEDYQFSKGVLAIRDEELGIDLAEPFAPQAVPAVPPQGAAELCASTQGIPDGQCLRFYRDGSLEAEMYYKKGLLHGPVSYYGNNGLLTARSWYFNGVRQGKVFWYYRSGALYAVQRFKDGVRQGLQEYDYPNGDKKSVIPYNNGIIEGEVLLYHPNNLLKRRVPFLHGKPHGQEEAWNRQGQKILEAEYAEGNAIGSARYWHENGQLAKQVVFGANSNIFDLTEWDPEGREVRTEKGREEVYPEDKSEAINREIRKELEKLQELRKLTGDEKQNYFF